MSSAKVTLIGFYMYDNTLFDGLDLPTQIEKDLLVDTILTRGGEYEAIYSDADFLKMAISSWSKRWKPVFTEWARAFDNLKEVAPLENYDRLENWSDSTSISEQTSMSHSEVNSLSTSESSVGSASTSGSDSSHGSESMSERGDISAYDASTLVANDGGSKSAQSNNNATTYTVQGNTANSIGAQQSNRNAIDNSNRGQLDYSTHGGRIHGNIGVVTTAKMYEEWIDTLNKAGNLYEKIATVFLQNFVIPLL